MQTIRSQGGAQIPCFLLAVLVCSCHHFGKDKFQVHGLQFRIPRPRRSFSLLEPFGGGGDDQTVARKPLREDDDPTTRTETRTSETTPVKNSVEKWLLLCFNYIKVHAVLIAVQFVLRLRLEQFVFSRLPPNWLLFILRTCTQAHARPRVLRIVAMESDVRIRQELLKRTGNEYYEFGCLTKAAIQNFTGKEKYEFGDLTKTVIQNYTGKEQYEFGDLTRTTFRRLLQATHEWVGRTKSTTDQQEDHILAE